MEIYLVGGAVRDALLGLPVTDRDWVVVGSSPAEMLALGFKPVGRDFPVFLHPQTHEEYALARTERKTAPGYHGFTFHAGPEVTLQQDLARRDITINSIAFCADLISEKSSKIIKISADALIDPFGGLQDLQRRQIRHTTEAFREDPVRILRVARFAARFADFHIVSSTQALMRSMVACGEAGTLVAERVWAEVAKGLMSAQPSRMLTVLRDVGALQHVLDQPIEASAQQTDAGTALDASARAQASLPVRYACWVAAAGALIKAPRDCAELALMVQTHLPAMRLGEPHSSIACLQFLEACDAFRRPDRFTGLLQATRLLGAPTTGHLSAAHAAARAVSLPQPPPVGPAAGRMLHALRLQAIERGWPGQA